MERDPSFELAIFSMTLSVQFSSYVQHIENTTFPCWHQPPIFHLGINFQNILRNTTQVIIRHRVKILFSIISSPITWNGKSENHQKLKGSSSLHKKTADKILKDSKTHNSSYRMT